MFFQLYRQRQLLEKWSCNAQWCLRQISGHSQTSSLVKLTQAERCARPAANYFLVMDDCICVFIIHVEHTR